MANRITVAAVLSSPKFVVEATLAALEEVARINGQTLELAIEAFTLETPNVVRNVQKLVLAAAEQVAKDLNAAQGV